MKRDDCVRHVWALERALPEVFLYLKLFLNWYSILLVKVQPFFFNPTEGIVVWVYKDPERSSVETSKRFNLFHSVPLYLFSENEVHNVNQCELEILSRVRWVIFLNKSCWCARLVESFNCHLTLLELERGE